MTKKPARNAHERPEPLRDDEVMPLDIPGLTPREQKVVSISVDPRFAHLPVRHQASLAGMSDTTFTTIRYTNIKVKVATQAFNQAMVQSACPDVLAAAIKNAMREKGFKDRKMLLEMARWYTPPRAGNEKHPETDVDEAAEFFISLGVSRDKWPPGLLAYFESRGGVVTGKSSGLTQGN